MKFTATLLAPRLNLSDYSAALHKYMQESISHAVSVWLEAVLLEIPVWSGASQATFTKLAQAIGSNLPIAPSVPSREGIGSAASDGGLEIGKGRYVFYYSTSLPWLIWNEYNNANVNPDPTLFYRVLKEGPYNFQMKGSLAFLRFASSVDLPPVAQHIRPVKV